MEGGRGGGSGSMQRTGRGIVIAFPHLRYNLTIYAHQVFYLSSEPGIERAFTVEKITTGSTVVPSTGVVSAGGDSHSPVLSSATVSGAQSPGTGTPAMVVNRIESGASGLSAATTMTGASVGVASVEGGGGGEGASVDALLLQSGIYRPALEGSVDAALEKEGADLPRIFPCTSPDTIADVCPTYLVRLSPLTQCFVSP